VPHPRFLFLLILLPIAAGCAGSQAAGTSPTSSPPPTAPSLAGPRPASYAALGASETYGMGAVPTTKGYAYLVKRALHARHFVDLGIPGTTLAQGYDTELTNALAARPALCTVFFGVNDLRARASRQAFLHDLHDLVATLRRSGARVLIVGMPDLSLLPAVARLRLPGVRAIVASWNAGMKGVARETGARFLDLRRFDRELAAHPEYISPDGLHPSNAGHARLAAVVLQAIRADRLWSRR
jgi:acyl-CoA thioesterase-1